MLSIHSLVEGEVDSDLKRYLLFAGQRYYPRQGFEDYKGSFETIAEAEAAGIELKEDWVQIVDLVGGTIEKSFMTD